MSVRRYECPYPNCGVFDFDETVSASEIEARLSSHLDAVHPGWTLEQVELQAEEKRKMQQIRRLFQLGPNEMFGHRS